MNFKNLASIAVVLTLMWGCQNSTKNQNQDNQSTESSQPGQTMPGQNQMTEAKDVTDEELTQFMSAMEHMQTINQSAQQEMVGAVQQEGMEVERFSEIMQSQQDPNVTGDATSEEMKKFAAVNQSLEKIQTSANQKMEEKIVETGLTLERYQEIGAMIQSNPELQQKLQSMEPTSD